MEDVADQRTLVFVVAERVVPVSCEPELPAAGEASELFQHWGRLRYLGRTQSPMRFSEGRGRKRRTPRSARLSASPCGLRLGPRKIAIGGSASVIADHKQRCPGSRRIARMDDAGEDHAAPWIALTDLALAELAPG